MQPFAIKKFKFARGIVLAFCSLLSALGGEAQAHGEFVRTNVVYQPQSGLFELTMIGQNSKLPILQAQIQAQLYPLTSNLKKQLGPSKDLNDALLEPANRVTYTPLEDQGSGKYVGKLSRVTPGEYVLLLVDTTFKGESANANRAIVIGNTPIKATLILPVTRTPSSWFVYALLGLLIPLGIMGGIMGVAWLDRRGKLKA